MAEHIQPFHTLSGKFEHVAGVYTQHRGWRLYIMGELTNPLTRNQDAG